MDAFAKHLAQTVLWCEQRASRANPKDSLRTLPIDTEYGFIDLTHEQRIEAVNELITLRQQQLEIEIYSTDELLERSKSGRLFLFYPDRSLFDGAAEVASKGYFDDYNVPGWDSWVCYGTDSSGIYENSDINFLVSWIPAAFIDYVQGAIDVNPEECIKWASDVDRNFTRLLIQQGLL